MPTEMAPECGPWSAHTFASAQRMEKTSRGSVAGGLGMPVHMKAGTRTADGGQMLVGVRVRDPSGSPAPRCYWVAQHVGLVGERHAGHGDPPLKGRGGL